MRTAVIAGLLLLGALAQAQPRSGRPDGYMVLPLVNKSPVKSLDWMASALATTAAEKLEGVASLRPAYGPRILEGVAAGLDDQAVAARAVEMGARWVIGGSFSRPNWKAEVTLRLWEVQGETTPFLRPVAEASAIGERGALLELLDQALLEILAKGRITVDKSGMAALRRPPTRDLYALTIYGRGLNLFYGIGVPDDGAGAAKQLAKAVVIDPKFAEAHRMLGVVHLWHSEMGKARAQYDYALDLRPDYYAAVVGLAELYRADGRRKQALEMAARAVQMRPWDGVMRFMLGELQWETGDLDHALETLRQVVEEHPRHLGARRTLVQVHAARGDIPALAAELERVAELTPEEVDVRMDLAAAFTRLGRLDRAIAALEEVVRRRPRHATAYKLLGDLYRRTGERERAIAAYERLRRIDPEDPRAWFTLGAMYAEARQDAKAEQAFDEAAQFPRHLAAAWTNLAAIALRRGETKRAGILLERAIAREPGRPKAHFNYALYLDTIGQREQALASLQRADELDPEDPAIPYLRGVVLIRLGRLDEAHLAFAEAVKRGPQHADARHNLALIEDLDRRYSTERAGRGSQ